MKRIIIFPAAAAIVVAALISSCAKERNDFDNLNARARQEYLKTIRCGENGQGPFWNRYANKFIFCPAFDFEEVAQAASYRFTLDYIDDVWRKPVKYAHGTDVPPMEEVLASFEPAQQTWTFTATSPKASLKPVWDEIPAGNVQLKVDAVDADGNVIRTVGARKFMRDFPFEGPYYEAIRPYREAAVMACIYNHFIPGVYNWVSSAEPDFSYQHNGYPAKIVGATISLEVLMSRLLPQYREQCLAAARNAAEWLISISAPAGQAMEFCPPTYWGDYITSANPDNKGTTMMMEPPRAARGYLDLYDACGEQKYFDAALAIARTIQKLQRPDGSLPIKVRIDSGEEIVHGSCTPTHLLVLWRRLASQYGVTEFAESLDKAEAYMKKVAIPSFDLTGQFEDVSVTDLHAFQNLTNGTYGGYAEYLLDKPDLSAEEVETALELTRFAEDQFVHWDALYTIDGFRQILTPCVFEQYQYQTPVNSSSTQIAQAYIGLYRATGERLYLEKARALMNTVMLMQNQGNGQPYTTWTWRGPEDHFYGGQKGYWVNCTLFVIECWLELEELEGE